MGIGIGDVTTVFAILVALGVVFPGLLLTWFLLLPGMVERSRERVSRTPWKTLGFGFVVLVLASVPLGILNALAGPFQFLAYAGGFLLLTLATIGAAGIAALMGERLRGQGINVTTSGALVRGAIVLEFAVVFPILGWFILFPVVLLISLGSAVFALLHWSPRQAREATDRAVTGTLQTVQSEA